MNHTCPVNTLLLPLRSLFPSNHRSSGLPVLLHPTHPGLQMLEGGCVGFRTMESDRIHTTRDLACTSGRQDLDRWKLPAIRWT